MTTKAELREQWNAKAGEVNAFYEKYPNDEDVPQDEARRLNGELAAIANQMKQFITADELRQSAKSLLEEQREQPATKTAPNGKTPPATPAAKRGSLGEQFMADPGYQAWFKAMAPSGRFAEKTAFASPQVAIESKTLITGAGSTSGGALVLPDQVPGIIPALRRPLTMRDIVTVVPTSSDTIEYVKVDTETNAAAPVAEATATGDASGTKPESGLTMLRVSDSVKTIAHWVPVTTRALADAPQIRAIIDDFLLYGLQEELEDQMVAGDGTGENFTGLTNVSGIQAQAWDTDIFTTMLRGRNKVRLVGRDVPNAYLMNPTDVEGLELQKDSNGQFYFGGPAAQGGNLMVWRLPVVENEGVPAGTGYVGNFRRAVLYDREEASIQASNSHADFFIRNMVAVLAELRAGFGVWRPKSIVELDLTAV